MTSGRVDQANVPDALRALLARVRILEAVTNIAPWAFMDSGVANTVAANGGAGTKTTPIDMAAASFYTNDAAVFATDTIVIGGVTYHGASILRPGHYEITVWSQPLWDGSFPTGGNSVLMETNAVGSFVADILFDGVPAAQQLTATIHDQLGLTLINPFTVTSPPTGPLIYNVVNHSNTAWHHQITYKIVQLDNDPTVLA